MSGYEKRKAFTLVELLVVIAIITILAAMLLPTLEQALHLTRMTACASNERQLYLGFAMYQNDFGDHMPAPADGIFANRLASYAPPDATNKRFTPLYKPMNSGIFYMLGYCRDTNLYLCPGNPVSSLFRDNVRAQFTNYDRTGNTVNSAVYSSYIHRGPRYQYDDWDDNIDYYNAYMGHSASKLANNCAGGQLGRISRKLHSAVALLTDLPPFSYWVETSSPHDKRGIVTLYADGVMSSKQVNASHPFMDPNHNLGSAQFGGKIWGTDVYHPSFDKSQSWYHSRADWLNW